VRDGPDPLYEFRGHKRPDKDPDHTGVHYELHALRDKIGQASRKIIDFIHEGPPMWTMKTMGGMQQIEFSKIIRKELGIEDPPPPEKLAGKAPEATPVPLPDGGITVSSSRTLRQDIPEVFKKAQEANDNRLRQIVREELERAKPQPLPDAKLEEIAYKATKIIQEYEDSCQRGRKPFYGANVLQIIVDCFNKARP
jgi:hypothetical protein